jgi:hypothetical protein
MIAWVSASVNVSTVVLGVRLLGSPFIGLSTTYPRFSNQFRVTRRLRS